MICDRYRKPLISGGKPRHKDEFAAMWQGCSAMSLYHHVAGILRAVGEAIADGIPY